jgi:hypothetical protein
MFMMIAFLDTEFTDLVTQPRLLSVGLSQATQVEPISMPK